MNRLSGIITRTRWLWLAGWPLLAFFAWWNAPSVSAILDDDATNFLPDHVPSRIADAHLREEFPDAAPESRVGIIAHRPDGLSYDDRAVLRDISSALASASPDHGWRLRSSLLLPVLAPILESEDKTTLLLAVELPAGPLTHHSVNRVRALQSIIAEHPLPEGLQLEQTGSAALGEMLDTQGKRSVDLTTVWAFAAVMIILLAVYRSPIAMLLPIVTIAVALIFVLGLLGRAASYGLPVNGLIEMFIIVILVGSGVDYCLFIFSRFREEMAAGHDVMASTKAALSQTGGAIVAGAGTNAAAMATLLLAGNRDLFTSGPTIAVAIVLGTLVVLTFAPALLSRFGRHLFWPARVSVTENGEYGAPTRRIWSSVAAFVVGRPGLCSVMALLLLLPFAVHGARSQPLYDEIEEFPLDSSFVRGARLYHRHIHNDHPTSDYTFVVKTSDSLAGNDAALRLEAGLDRVFESLKDSGLPIAYQRDLGDPLGIRRTPRAGASHQLIEHLLAGPGAAVVRQTYLGSTRQSTRIDIGLAIAPRSPESLAVVTPLRLAVEAALLEHVFDEGTFEVFVTGEPASYVDMRELRNGDFRLVAAAACLLIYMILLWMIRSPLQSVILVGATLLAYLAAYGATTLVFWHWMGLAGLNWQIDFMLFIIIMSLGQDYNIFVVARIREEQRSLPLREAVEVAVSRTGGVVSSCGIIMAATFASMLSGSLVIMKELAVALSLGILMDTFIIRPVLVPSLVLMLERARLGMRGRRVTSFETRDPFPQVNAD
ncbi:MAG: MMPL family transporter [Planctomycetota bacterium]